MQFTGVRDSTQATTKAIDWIFWARLGSSSMKSAHTLTALLVPIPTCLCLVSAEPVRAELFIDAYGGGAFTMDGDARLAADGLGAISGEIDFDNSGTGGIRAGYWLDFAKWAGIAADVSYFKADPPRLEAIGLVDGEAKLDTHIVPITPLIMFRTPLFRTGRQSGFQPYIGVGPSFFLSYVDGEAKGFIGPDQIDLDFEDHEVELGVDGRIGVNLHIYRHFLMLFEYRFTYFEAEFSDNVNGTRVELDADVGTHHVLAGFGFLF